MNDRKTQAFLESLNEDLDVEIKDWLDFSQDDAKANIAKALIALANHGGGRVVLGHKETHGGYEQNENRPSDLRKYSQDIINGIVQKYAEPSFHCKVNQITHPESNFTYPVILVPEGHKVPIRCRKLLKNSFSH